MFLALIGSMRLTGSGVQGLSSRQEVGLGQATPSSLPDLQRTVFSHPGPVPPSSPGQLLKFLPIQLVLVLHIGSSLQVCILVLVHLLLHSQSMLQLVVTPSCTAESSWQTDWLNAVRFR